MDDSQISYAVKLPAFEGPLDLLLHLIKKNEINIYDIPIALITGQYLEYLSLMTSLNLAVAGEFLVMAATLIHIKSKTLLPPSETDEEDEEDDPRADLVTRLLEYQRFKDAAQGFELREQEWREVFYRPAPHATDGPTDEINLVDLSLFDLLEALRGVMERAPEKKGLEIVVDELSVQDRMSLVLDRLEREESITFTSLFDDDTTRLAMIVTFLALLELIRLKRVRILQAELFGTIRVWKNTNLQPS
ncbi:MAG: segregation/condensation protein A [Nitrospirae bacterium]|nr:segregation/condensation protein A [Nitrospirota bacterium]